MWKTDKQKRVWIWSVAMAADDTIHRLNSQQNYKSTHIELEMNFKQWTQVDMIAVCLSTEPQQWKQLQIWIKCVSHF